MGSYGRFNRDDVNCLLDEYGGEHNDDYDYNELMDQAYREKIKDHSDQEDHDQQDHDQSTCPG